MFSKLNLNTKQDYRNYAGEIRENLDIPLISRYICAQIAGFDIYKEAKNICGFYSFGNEIDMKELFQDCSRNWYLPKVVSETEMIFYKYENCTLMEKNRFGIYEPVIGEKLHLQELDVIIVPALIIDEKGHRLGYGKGYYDRFLSKLPKSCTKIAPIPEELLVKTIPYDNFDIPVDFAVTQDNIYKFPTT